MANPNPSPIELTDEQRAIVETDEDTIVISNPGTGKTTTLSARVVKLLEDEVKPEEILCITFTDKALSYVMNVTSEEVWFWTSKFLGVVGEKVDGSKVLKSLCAISGAI